ncbi:hypothetical protein VTN31DRAFT_3792 [Thermomyces dupontii]|uniref:uncharacterized protein n=1 Tax=Talaromyces thermophilus TaxID=28565 RepID=UPI0037422C3B
MNNTIILTGHCPCNRVQYTALYSPRTAAFCPCGKCAYILSSQRDARRGTTGQMLMNPVIPERNFRLGPGSGAVQSYMYFGERDHPMQCFYCAACKGHIYHTQQTPPPPPPLLLHHHPRAGPTPTHAPAPRGRKTVTIITSIPQNLLPSTITTLPSQTYYHLPAHL